MARDYPGSPEAENALQSLETIYVRNNNIEGYLAFVNELGRDISNKQQDSLMYAAAENTYSSGDCRAAIESLNKYLGNHPNGNYLLNAHYYKADCHLKLNQPNDALASLDYIASQPRNMFSELALVASSGIHFSNGSYNKAVNQYLRLLEIASDPTNVRDARIGVMRCYYLLKEYANTISAAAEVINIENRSAGAEREAWYLTAKSHMALNRTETALEYFRRNALDVSSAEGAESKYMVAEIMYKQATVPGRGDKESLTEVENEIFEFIGMNTPHQYWMGKAFLLLSDVYLGLGDEFQAIHSLKSIIDYYAIQDDGIVEEAKRRHDNLAARVDSQIFEEIDTVNDLQ